MLLMNSRRVRMSSELEGYDFVRFTVIDIVGQSRSKLIPVAHAITCLDKGFISLVNVVAVLSYDSHIPDVSGLGNKGCVLLRPIARGLRKLPWASDKYNLCEYICEISWPLPNCEPMKQCPRYAARLKVEQLQSEFRLQIRLAYEMEFIVTEGDTKKPITRGYNIFNTQTFTKYEQMSCDLLKMMEEADIQVEAYHCEYMSGSFEMSFIPQLGMKMADDITRVKSGIKQFFEIRGYTASFMTRQPDTEVACCLQMNMSLMSGNKNVFYDKKNGGNISTIGRHWVAGILRYCNSFAAIYCPTVNCYRRLHQPWSPHKADWDVENRFVAVRVRNLKDVCVELRMPSGTTNPYLSLAATLGAGMQGMRNKMTLPDPVDPEASVLPHSLEEAVNNLNEDKEAISLLGEELVDWFTVIKRETEIEKLRHVDITNREIHKDELELYHFYG